MRVVICHGRANIDTMLALLGENGIRRPYVVATMDTVWWEIAAELGRPRYFFKNKLRMMNFAASHHMIAVVAKDRNPESWSMAASFETMGATLFEPEGEED